MTDDAPIVVSADWLAARLDRIRIVDVREAWEYEGIGHVPGAVNVPFDSFRGGGGVGTLPGAERFAEVVSEAGISPDDTVVAYDDEHGVFAARFVVTALAYGHRNVHLLDGDFSAWRLAHEVTTESTEVEPTEYEMSATVDLPLIDAEDVATAIDDPDAVLVDTRTDEEFREGHIRGAVHLDWRELVDVETRGLKPRDELLGLLEGHGIAPDRRVVLYCNTARRISHTYVALRHLGFERVDFYEGSLTDWIERGLDLVGGEG